MWIFICGSVIDVVDSRDLDVLEFYGPYPTVEEAEEALGWHVMNCLFGREDTGDHTITRTKMI